MNDFSVLENIILTLPSQKDQHCRETSLYAQLQQQARKEVQALFSDDSADPKPFKPFGELIFPYHKMGAIDSLNLFDLDELIIFGFYWANRKRYKRVADIGANIGLHSILLAKGGYDVHAYEPDPQTFEILKRNLALNKCSSVHAYNEAVSSESGELEFVRVLGNLTGSHLAGSKANPYGELERFPVKVEAIEPIIEWADLIKLDAEGHEKRILLATSFEQWRKTDAILEIDNEGNAVAVYEHFNRLKVNLFSQKLNWQLVRDIKDVPISYREGSLFITCKDEMPW